MSGAPVLADRLQQAADTIDAPDVVLAISEHGHRTLVTSGTAAADTRPPRAELCYEIGSASKTFLGLLLAEMVHSGQVEYETSVRSCLSGRVNGQHGEPTLRQLITHTAGLLNMPHQIALYRNHLLDWPVNPYTTLTTEELLRAFRRRSRRARPGHRWGYSSLATAVCAYALACTAQAGYWSLLTERVLRPLAMPDLRRTPGPSDAAGHRRDGTPALPSELGALAPVGDLRATPAELLTYLEAHLRPDTTPLGSALHAVRVPHTAPRPRRAPARSLTWFTDDTDHGRLFFHGGATFGQIAYLGYRPDTRTALVALATRRDRANTLINTAHAVLTDLVPTAS